MNLKLKSGTSVAEYTSEFQSLVNQLSSVEMPLGDEIQALLLLSSLLNSWETLVMSLSNSALDSKLTMSMIKDALLNEEAKRKDVDTDQSHALVTMNWGRQQGGFRGRERGKSKSRGRSIDGKKPTYKCYYCGIEGHLKKNCKKLLREQGHNSLQPKNKEGETLVTISGEVAICSIHEETCLHVSI